MTNLIEFCEITRFNVAIIWLYKAILSYHSTVTLFLRSQVFLLRSVMIQRELSVGFTINLDLIKNYESIEKYSNWLELPILRK